MSPPCTPLPAVPGRPLGSAALSRRRAAFAQGCELGHLCQGRPCEKTLGRGAAGPTMAFMSSTLLDWIDPFGLDRSGGIVAAGLPGGAHFDRGTSGERLLHKPPYRFNRLGQLVQHTGRVIGPAVGKAKEVLEHLRRVKPDFFRGGGLPFIVVNPCYTEPMFCGPSPKPGT
jgi:hypothetical protein